MGQHDPPPPLPIAATYAAATDVCVVTFDKELIPGATAINNWTGVARFNIGGTLVNNIAPGVVAGNQATIPMNRGLAGALPVVIDYSATPADVINLDGFPAVAFANFPMTMVP